MSFYSGNEMSEKVGDLALFRLVPVKKQLQKSVLKNILTKLEIPLGDFVRALGRRGP